MCAWCLGTLEEGIASSRTGVTSEAPPQPLQTDVSKLFFLSAFLSVCLYVCLSLCLVCLSLSPRARVCVCVCVATRCMKVRDISIFVFM